MTPEIWIGITGAVIALGAAVFAWWQAAEARKSRIASTKSAEILEKRSTENSLVEWDADWYGHNLRVTNVGLDAAHSVRYKLILADGSVGIITKELPSAIASMASFHIDVSTEIDSALNIDLRRQGHRLTLLWLTESGIPQRVTIEKEHDKANYIYF